MAADRTTPDDEAATPADIITPHDQGQRKDERDVAEELSPGIVDPRTVPGPEILDPPAAGLPLPDDSQEDVDKGERGASAP